MRVAGRGAARAEAPRKEGTRLTVGDVPVRMVVLVEGDVRTMDVERTGMLERAVVVVGLRTAEVPVTVNGTLEESPVLREGVDMVCVCVYVCVCDMRWSQVYPRVYGCIYE
jgi:hypothetical protein